MVDESTLSPAARNMLQRIGNATPGLMDSIIADMVNLSAMDLDDVFKVVLPKIEQAEIDLYIIRDFYVHIEAYRVQIISALRKYTKRVGMGSIPILTKMREIDSDAIDELLAIWKSSGVVPEKFVNRIQGREEQ